jgi:hypothetical protein
MKTKCGGAGSVGGSVWGRVHRGTGLFRSEAATHIQAPQSPASGAAQLVQAVARPPAPPPFFLVYSGSKGGWGVRSRSRTGDAIRTPPKNTPGVPG